MSDRLDRTESLCDLMAQDAEPWDPTPMDEARGIICSELGALTASTPVEARVNAMMVRGVDDLLRYVERYPALDLLREVREGHPAEAYVRTARALLDLQRICDSGGLARAACAHEIEHWRRREADIKINDGGPLW